MPAPGDKFDRFEVEAVLGQGGMATVYRVRHGSLGSLHALKVLDVGSPKVRARLVQEGQVQARLRHPNVVMVTDLVDVAGAPGLIMEYVPGPSLEAWLRDHRPDPETATRIFDGVLDAVTFAHENGLVHRDLKPGNVLLETVNGRLLPKVTDFGLAKVLGPEGAGHTRSGFAMGTPGYMAPEQIRSAADVDTRADIFALGCILYDLWCGEHAFPGEDIYAELERMETRAWKDPRTLRPDIPDRVANAIAGALEPNREDRIASCVELRAVLDGRAAPRRALTRSDTMIGSSRETFDASEPRRSAVPVFAGLGVGLFLALGLAGLCAGGAWWWLRDRETPVVAAPQPAPVAEAVTTEPPPSPDKPLPPAPRPATARAGSKEPVVISAPPVATPPVATPPEPVPEPVRVATEPVAAPEPVVEPKSDVGTFVVSGSADQVWLDARGRRFGAGSVPAGSYTLHARWGEVEIERKVRVVAGGTLTASCDPTFLDCTIR